MEEPSLMLAILQGPRKGETFDFRPGSTVRVGRVVRGNTLAIKDAGISSKHLFIKSDSGKWTIQDLDSSNGTTLNSSRLPPFEPSHLHDGDEIKLGELTSMMVQLRIQTLNPSSPPVRRSRRGQLKSVETVESEARVPAEKPKKLETAEADDNPEPSAVAAPNVRKRGRPPKPRVPAQQVEPPPTVAAATSVPKRGRQPKARVPTQNVEPPAAVGRGTRSTKKEIMTPDPDCLESETQWAGRRRSTGEKNLQQVQPENAGLVVVEVKEEQLSLAEETQGGGDANEEIVNSREEEQVEDERGSEAVGNETEMSQKSNADKQEEHVPVTMTTDGHDSAKQRGEQYGGEVGAKPDLEKMTAREWFDYMEVQLRKEIMEASERSIEELRLKAERVREYVVEQKRNKRIETVG